MGLGLVLLEASSLYSGFSAQQSASQQAQWQLMEGELAKQDYAHKGYLALDEGYRLRQRQAMEYIGAGVEIQGTPLLMLAETKRRVEVEADWINRTGGNINILSQAKASTTKNEGRSAFISSIFSAGGYLLAGR